MTLPPVVERELRVIARRKGTYRLRFFSALGAIAIFLFFVSNRHTWMSNAVLARSIFETMAGFAMVICALSGLFLTADCLSSEKREGTLGLLFLTDLRGYDVVGGKLTASSIHAVYALLAMLPVMGLPLLMGGVAAGEFWRMTLALLVALIFSLGIGMLVSAIAREGRQAFALTLFLIIFFTGVLPAVYGVGLDLAPFKFRAAKELLWPSVGYTFFRSSDNYYAFGGRTEYWNSLITVAAIGITSLALASIVLPRTWQEKSQRQSARGGEGGWWRRLRFGSAGLRRARRLRALARNPFYWLAIRDHSSVIVVWVVAILAIAVWLFGSAGLVPGRPGGFQGISYIIAIYTTFLFSLVLKYCITLEATRRFCDDRQSGALELLLVTPLTITKMLAGQKRALRTLFGIPMGILVLLWLMQIWVEVINSGGQREITKQTVIMMGGNVVCLFTDFSALGWLGMWRGLRAGKHHRAILGTLIPIIVMPWLAFIFLGISGMLDGKKSDTMVGLWFCLGVINDFVWIQRARFSLRREFRAAAAGIAPKSEPNFEMIDMRAPQSSEP